MLAVAAVIDDCATNLAFRDMLWLLPFYQDDHYLHLMVE